MPRSAFPLYPILDVDAAGSRDLVAAARGWAGLGLRRQQLRAKRLGGRAFLELATNLAAVVPELIVNDRADVARLAGAAGVHVGQDDLQLEAVRQVVGEAAIIGVSTHSPDQIARVTAGPQHPSYLAIGPVFATSTKKDPDPVVGLEGVRRARQLWPGELVAIGGIDRANCRSVWEAGADAVAVIGDLWRSPDPVVAAQEFLLAFAGLSCHSPEE